MNALTISVTIDEYGKKHVVQVPVGVRLRDILEEELIPYSYACGGEGRCGRCRVRFLYGAPEASLADKELLTGEELAQGVRLLCRGVLDKDCHILLDKIAADTGMKIESLKDDGSFSQELTYGIAVDIGTTTIAAALISVPSDENGIGAGASHDKGAYNIVRTASCVNSQRIFGTDVISRISAAEDDEVHARLGSHLVSDLSNLIKELTSADEASGACNIKAITVTGNTTMLHLLMGRDVSGLGKYPYEPVTLQLERMESDFIFGGIKDAKLTLLPGISAFVGADIVAGLSTLDIDPGEKFFFLDIGTNGEMVFFDGKKFKAASAAAGPAFEAGGISCGTASIPGAISHVTINADTKKAVAETIDGQEPIGICGTGVMETVSELLSTGIIDSTGLLKDEFFDKGYPLTEDGLIRFTQQDIRSVQLAKAAIFTGAKALLQGDEPARVYVAGGFGANIIPEKIASLGMFPGEFDDKIEAVGNTALKGAAKFTAAVLCGWEAEKEAIKGLDDIISKSEAVELAALDSFDEDYIAAMNF